MSNDGDGPIRASGCLVYRWLQYEDGVPTDVEVLVAHRPRYDDWDFPKGKLEAGESDLECAVRETEEETGQTGSIGDELLSDTYVVRGRNKVVRWWLLERTGGEFVPNDEVDEVRWLSPEQAFELLSYDHARSLFRYLPGRS